MSDLLSLRRVRLLVEELENRSTPSASPGGLDLHWLGQQQLATLRADALQVRTMPDSTANVTVANQLPAATPLTTPLRHEVILIDSAVPDLDQFVAQLEAGLPPGAWYDLYLIDATHGGVEQISAILGQYHRELDAVHLFSHGASGQLQIGADLLDLTDLNALAHQIAGWGDALHPYGDLLLYGCDVAAGAQGEAFVEQLHQLTGLDVAASTNDTGSARLGGDWMLETHLGDIGSAPLALADRADAWSGLLNTYTVLNRNDSGFGSLRQAILDANANAGADLINFGILGVGTQTINLASELPTITGAVTLDATTQLGFSGTPLIVLNGGNAVADGLTLGAGSDGSEIRGFVINRFTGDAIEIVGGSGNNLIAGNYLGTSSTGNAASGNGGWGIRSSNAGSGNLIGGTTAADRNVIGDNAAGGILLDGGSSTTIRGNYIGVGANGSTALGNDGNGITVTNGSDDNRIGGTGVGQGNVIANNAIGIAVFQNDSQAIISGNSIYDNVGLGIDLDGDGVTTNDPGDGDSGGNVLKNYPTLTSAVVSGGTITITGSLNSVATGNYRIEFFANAVGDPSGFGEGQRYLGFIDVTTDGSGNVSFAPTLTAAVSPGEYITATNTDLDRDVTSEFSVNIMTPAAPLITSNGGGSTASVSVAENNLAVLTVSATDPNGDPLTYSIVGGADAARFAIDPTTGLLSFLVAPNFESPTDVGVNNVYNVTVQVDDGDGGTDTQAIAVTVTNVNEAPILTLPEAQVTAVNAARVFSAANLNQLTVSDDSGAASIRMTLTVSSGRLTLGSVAGVTFTVGDGVSDATMTFTGSQAAVNNAIATLTYLPNASFVGIDALQVTVNDLGNSGSGGAQITSGSVMIEVVQEIQVNSTKSHTQTDVVVAMDARGNFVMAWVVDGSHDGDKRGIFARRFDSSGNPLGLEFQVNTTTHDEQKDPAIAMDADGNFVIVWMSQDQDGNGRGVFGQRYDATGAAVGGEFQVNTGTSGNQDAPGVAMDADGDFVVVWRSDRGGTGSDIWAQRYDANGVAQGGEFVVNVNVTDNQDQPAVAMDAAGNFVVAWRSNKQDGSGAGVFVRMFDASGNPQSGEIQANTTNSGNQDKPTIARNASGAFVVAWASGNNQDGDKRGIYARRFDATGTPQGSEFLVNVTTNEDQDRPSVGMDDSGAFTIAWSSNNQDGNEKGVYARRFQANGSPAGGEFRVSGTTQKQQERPTVAMDGIGDLVIGWQGNGIGDDKGVFAQVYRSVNDPPSANVPPAQSLFKNTSLTFSTASGNGVTLSDPDAGSAPVRLTISVTNGRLTFASTAGLTFTVGDGTSDAAITVTGTLAALNAALNGMTYVPNTGYAGGDVLQINVNDLGNTGAGGALGASASVTLTVVNRAPVASADAYGTNEDVPLTVAAPGVLGNDVDSDGDTITAVLVSGPSNGTLSFNANGSFTYTPNANFNGTDTFTYRASDGSATSAVTTVTIIVSAVNDAPVGVNDSYSTNEDTTLTVGAAAGVLANDTDVDGPSRTADLVTGPAHGTLTLNPNGSFIYTPTGNYNGPDSFTYRVSDGTLQSALTTVNLTVNAVNDAPVGVADSYSTNEDTTLTVNAAAGVLANDIDVDNATLTAVLVSGPIHGVLTLGSDGSFVYTPAANYNGPDSFTYRASDGNLSSAITTVSLTVSSSNDAPVAGNDAYSTNEDTTLTVNAAAGVLANDSDVDSPTLTAILVAGPSHGALTLNPDGSFTYVPAGNYNGPDSFTYQASDGSLLSNVATVTLNVVAVNDAPVAVDDSYSTNEDTTLTVNAATGLLANDSDVDNPTLTVVLVTGPLHGTLSLDPNGSFTYTPAANYNGPDSFTYRASDGSLLSNVATVTLNVVAVNDAPVAVDDAYSTNEDTTLTVNAAAGLLANDSDVDNPTLTVVLVAGPTHGTLTLNPNGSFTYVPFLNDNGPDSFTYRTSDGSLLSNVATVTLNVIAVNDAPVAAGDSYSTNEDTTLTVDAASGVLANDVDVDNPTLTAVLVTGPLHGTLTLNSDGSFTYVPFLDDNGPDSFTYQAFDGNLLSNVVTVTLTVGAVNDAPVAGDDAYSTNEDTPLTIAAPGVLGNDGDVDDATITAVLVAGPTHGTLTLNPNGSFTYTPDADYNGPDSFTYQAFDGNLLSNVATVTLTVNAVNDAPVAGDDAYATDEDTPLVVGVPGVLANDGDVDSAALTAVLVTGPTHGTLSLAPDGSFTYTPDPDYFGPDSFTYQVSDGSLLSNVATVTLTVTAVNDAPVAADDAYATNEDNPLVVAALGVLANDADVDDATLSAILVTGPTHGALTLNADGSFVYTPDADYNGADSFTYQASDGSLLSGVVTVTLTVVSVNDAPVGVDTSYVLAEDTPLTIAAAAGVLADDFDVDRDTLSAYLVDGPLHGSLVLNLDGSFTYAPDANYNGRDGFTYRAGDGVLQSDLVTVSFDVTPVNDAPVLKSTDDDVIFGSLKQGASVTVTASSIVGLATDVDGDPLDAELVNGPSHGTLTRDADGNFVFVPDDQYVGGDSFQVRVTDGLLRTSIITILIDVEVANLAPPILEAPPYFDTGANSTSWHVDALNEGLLGGGRGTGIYGGDFGVGGEETNQIAQALIDANAFRGDFPGSDKTPLTVNPVTIARADAYRDDGRFSVIVHPAAPSTAAPIRFQAELWQQQTVQLYQTLDEVGQTFREQVASRHNTVLVVGGATVTVTAGYLLWTLRSIYVLLSALAARPLWKHFDPLLILDQWDRGEEDDVEKMFD